MKKTIKLLVVLLALAFVLMQFWRPERTNPEIVFAETLEASIMVPENVNAVLKRSCADCHSNKTNWIWYSNIAPISWGMIDHVNEGREKLNFSKWSTYAADRKLRKLDEICTEIETGEMPHPQYLWLHWDAKLSSEEVKLVCEWAKHEIRKLNPGES